MYACDPDSQIKVCTKVLSWSWWWRRWAVRKAWDAQQVVGDFDGCVMDFDVCWKGINRAEQQSLQPRSPADHQYVECVDSVVDSLQGRCKPA